MRRRRPARLRKMRKISAPGGLVPVRDLVVQPGAGVGPIAVGGGARDTQDFGRLLDGQAREVAELDQISFHPVLARELCEGFVQRDEICRGRLASQVCIVEVESLPTTAMLEALLVTCPFDENAAHGLGRGGEEMGATVPIVVFCADKPDVRFVNKSGRLERLAGRFVRKPLSSQTTQLLIDDR